MNKKLNRLATNDAYDWGVAKLLKSDIAWKVENITGYKDAFDKAWATQDLSDEAKYLAKFRDKIIKNGGVGHKKSHPKLKIAAVVVLALVAAKETGLLQKGLISLADKINDNPDKFRDTTRKVATVISPSDTAWDVREKIEDVVKKPVEFDGGETDLKLADDKSTSSTPDQAPRDKG